VELRQLRYFVAVAEELHFRRAAARLHVSQPPLSQQIARLEDELGCRLLNRTRRRVELTAAGEAFLRDARAMLGELDVAVDTVRRIDTGQAGLLRVNFVGSALLSIVPGIVQRFRRGRPEVEIELRERSTAEQLRALSGGVVDVGLVRPPIDPGADLRTQLVMRERTVAAIPVGHPLAALRRVPLQRLAAEPLVLFPREQAPGYHDLLTGRLAATGTSPQVVQYAPEELTIIGLVAAGIGVSPVPASVARLALDGVTYRPVSGAPDTELLAVTRAGDESPLVEAFVADALAHPA
jgi:DNA-binding transcriptional LysR family regulator